MGIFDFFKGNSEDQATDPVCGMKVSKKDAKFKFDHEGKTDYFCSGGCFEAFKKEPKSYSKQ